MDYKLRDQIKTILQECYNVDMADERGREYIADMIVSNMSEDKEDGELKYNNYNGELNKPVGRVVENEEDYMELQKKLYDEKQQRNKELAEIEAKNVKMSLERARRLEKRKKEELEMTPEKKKYIEQQSRQNIMIKNEHFFCDKSVVKSDTTQDIPQKQKIKTVVKKEKPVERDL